MKLLSTLKYAVVAGLATLALPMAAQAALNFGNWTVGPVGTDVGVIDGCPSGVATDCTVLVTGEGFLQQQYDDGTNVYIQTIITDPNANCSSTTPTCDEILPYADESFVRSSGTSSGIAAKQTMSDSTLNFSGSATLYLGWATAEANGAANLNITQGFTDPGNLAVTGDEFSSNFGLKINLDSAGNQTGKSLSMAQTVEMGNGVDVNTTDIQSFVIEQRAGDLLTDPNPGTGFALGNTSFDPSTGDALNGTNNNDPNFSAAGMPAPLTWTAGDDVMMVWLGQQVSADGGGLSSFGFERATVDDPATATKPDQEASTFSTDTVIIDTNNPVSPTNPFNWDTVSFGAVPTLPAP